MVLEIATGLTPLAMTVIVVTLSRFAGVRWLSQIVPRNGTEAVPYMMNPKCAKNPPIPRNRGISHYYCSSLYAERELATGREVLLE